MRTFFFFGCGLLIVMFLTGKNVIIPWGAIAAGLADIDSGGHYRGSGGYHK